MYVQYTQSTTGERKSGLTFKKRDVRLNYIEKSKHITLAALHIENVCGNGIISL